MRLFVAICFSDEIKALLSSVCQKLKTQSLSGNFTRPENLHMTLAFIGESNRVAAVKSAMQQCTGAPFKLSLSGVGRFGDLWWVGIAKNPALLSLADRLRQTLRASGFQIDARVFRPHITIARQVVLKKAFDAEICAASMLVTHISLMQSKRLNGRIYYTELYRKQLL